MRTSGTYLFHIMKSHYCKAVFALAFFGSYFFIPHKVFYDGYAILALGFMLGFAAVFTCLIRSLKEHVSAAKVGTNSMLGALATVLGFSALQVCGIGLPICGMSFGFSILSALLPGFIISAMMSYAVPLVMLSIVMQAFSLHQMGCFAAAQRCCHTFKIPEINLK